MKYFLLVLIALTFFANSAFATSGACSHHGGVNCSAGADYDGSVICYDEWKNSSVSYNSMVKCRGYSSFSKSGNQTSNQEDNFPITETAVGLGALGGAGYLYKKIRNK